VEVKLHAILTSAANGGEWSALCSMHFAHGEITVSTHWLETGWTSTDSMMSRRIPAPTRNLTPSRNTVLAFLSFLASRNADLVGDNLIINNILILAHVYGHI
jgi:hypothetical protein